MGKFRAKGIMYMMDPQVFGFEQWRRSQVFGFEQ
jgi:hypothetical protein